MDDATREHYETQSKDLRVRIKTWELDFSKVHGGKKPSRLDIKNNREMAAAYKEYQRLRDALEGKVSPPARKSRRHHQQQQHDDDSENTDARKRRSPQPPSSHTPSAKRFRAAAETPSSSRYHPAHSTMHMFTPGAGAGAGTDAVTPSLSRKLFSPAVPTSIGPTPQRDGRVLGLFDSLPFKDAEIDSPCKPSASVRLSQVIEAGRRGEAPVEETPRKKSSFRAAAGVDGMDPDLALALGRTPSSSRHKKRTGQASPRKGGGGGLLATPLKPHDGNRVAKTPGTSSSSVSRLQFQTPAFLRRIPIAKITESSDFVSPEPIRLPRKPLLRGLSSVVADLRRLQEEELDEELDALREVENETAAAPATGGGGGARSKKATPAAGRPDEPSAPEKAADSSKAAGPGILAEDAQKQNMILLGGFDDEAKYDSPDEENAGLDRNGQPLRVFKKKGQKRTTRRVNMRPVRAKRPTTAAASTDEGGEEDEDTPTIQQHTEADLDDQEEDPALLSGSEFAGSEDDEDELAQDIGTIKPPKKATSIAKTKPTTKNPSAEDEETKKKPLGGSVKKAARKVNELAHANFKRLKLRNSGAKGGPGYNSRFRRRR